MPCKDADRYQPFGLQSFQPSCVWLISKCGEPGQVAFSDGNASTDTACLCNFKEEWAFVSKPINGCSCLPSENDCSCYRKRCPDGYVLSPGIYVLVLSNIAII